MDIHANIEKIRNIIEKKKASLGISYPINIIAVTKTLPSAIIREAFSAGIKDFGENRVQEAETKFSELKDLSFKKHMIGHLQENKANKAASLFDMVQSLDSFDTAQKLNKKCLELNKIMPALIEVNTSLEQTKSGVREEQAEEFAARLIELKALKVSGFMTIGPFGKPPAETRLAFRNLYRLREKLSAVLTGTDFSILSMGMSDDFETAIEEGANMVRLGRALFGRRN